MEAGGVKALLLDVVQYGIFYAPCLTQFVINRIIRVQMSGLGGGIEIEHFFDRFLLYLFDPSLGFGTFATLAVVVFLVLAIVGVFRRKPRSLIWMGFLLGTVAAYSLMRHINCGMKYCARYIIFTWPIIPMFLATDGYELMRPTILRKILYPAMVLSACLLLRINISTGAYEFSRTAQWILQNVPQLYAPYSATFYCRTLHVDGAYNIIDPAYYLDPQTDEVRKLIYKADEGQAEQVLYDLTGDEGSVSYLREKLEKNGTDGKYHYINFPASGTRQVREKTPEEKGELVSVATVVDERDVTVGYPTAGGLIYFPFIIKENTIYKVDISLEPDTSFSSAVEAKMCLDFYGPNYDRGEQQVVAFIKEGKYYYSFYFNSGEMDSEALDGNVRMFTTADTGECVGVKTLCITEMART